MTEGALAYIAIPIVEPGSVDTTLVRLGQSAAALLGNSPTRSDLVSFARAYLDAIRALPNWYFQKWRAAIFLGKPAEPFWSHSLLI